MVPGTINKPTQNFWGVVAMVGATLVGVVFKVGVLLAADRRVTLGSYVHGQAKKVHVLDGNLIVGFAGLIADAQALLRVMREEIRYYSLESGKGISVEAASRLLSNILYSYKMFPMMTEAMLGGVEGAPKLVVLDPLGSTISDDYAAAGTGGAVAMGVLENGYRRGMSRDEAVDLAVRAVRVAARRDALTGDKIDIVIATREGTLEETRPL